MELGSGSGYVICSAALLLRQLGVVAQLMATDVNPEAAAATMKTLRAHEVLGRGSAVGDWGRGGEEGGE